MNRFLKILRGLARPEIAVGLAITLVARDARAGEVKVQP